MNEAGNVFESFNARALQPAQVARTFVPPEQFAQLCKRRHTLVVGPRGSGKTTLLKMLQQAALETWGHERASQFVSKIDFTGIFVAADVSWSEQLQAVGEGRLDPESQQLLALSAFTTHSLRALATAMQNRVAAPISVHTKRKFRRVDMAPAEEAMIARAIARAWQLDIEVPTLLSLKQALTQRNLDIRSIGNREALLGPDGRPQRLAKYDFLHLTLIQAATVACEVFDDVAGQQGSKWAWAFDELELAPKWIRQELIRSLRSADERFIFKLALSPFNEDVADLQAALRAAQGHDYDQIPLWYVDRRKSYKFCEELWYAMLDERGVPRVPPRKALGKSYFEQKRPKQGHSLYEPGSAWHRQFVTLRGSDRSFARYLDDRQLDLNELHNLPEDRRAADIRKVAPLIPVRLFYRASEAVTTKRIRKVRSRKAPSLYTGAAALFAISEGNPRWFIGIVERLLDDMEEQRISRRIQAHELKRAAMRFAAMLRTIPIPRESLARSYRGVLGLVSVIADFVHDEVVLKDFAAEPPGSFIVDSDANEDLIAVVAQALNAGAIVYVPEGAGEMVLSSLRGKRFRLSYMLAPVYGLPLRLGKPTSLGRILRDRGKVDRHDPQLHLMDRE